MRVTLAQLNPLIGDLEGNREKIATALTQAEKDSSDLLILPELFLVGYPPRDILEKTWFIENTQNAISELEKLSSHYLQTGILVGAPIPNEKIGEHGLSNSALLIYKGETLFNQAKSLLPTYDVFDEARYFDPTTEILTVPFKGEVLGISICEDAWNAPEPWAKRNYPADPIDLLAKNGATLMINIAASPFHVGKEELRYQIFKNHAKKHRLPFVFVNQVGANDELIFDGRSLVVDKNGEVAVILPAFEEQITTIDTNGTGSEGFYMPQEKIASVYQALVLGIKDYMKKCGFSKAIVGLSGGIDSSVTCCLAKDAVGENNVLGVAMPSPYSSQASLQDARELAANLGISFKTISISAMYDSYTQSLQEHLKVGEEVDITLQNIQARIRGNVLMALSNRFGYLLLSTGNKSELAVGYCTLYGDMSGGLAVISDVPKTMVYELADYINKEREIIPHAVITKPPSAELKPDQVDQDTLPPYETLDQILYHFIDQGCSFKEILDMGFAAPTVKWVIEAVTKNEYKRRQAAPGLKVTTKAFGVGRRMAIAAKYEI